MAYVATFGNPLVKRLCEAIGLDFHKTQRFVIAIEPDDVVKVYAVLLPEHPHIEKVCEAFEVQRVDAVVVTDDAKIIIAEIEK